MANELDADLEARLNLCDSNVARASEITAAVNAAVAAARANDHNEFVHVEFERRLAAVEVGQIAILSQLARYNSIMNRWMGAFFVLTVVGAFLTWVISVGVSVKEWFIK